MRVRFEPCTGLAHKREPLWLSVRAIESGTRRNEVDSILLGILTRRKTSIFLYNRSSLLHYCFTFPFSTHGNALWNIFLERFIKKLTLPFQFDGAIHYSLIKGVSHRKLKVVVSSQSTTTSATNALFLWGCMTTLQTKSTALQSIFSFIF